MPCIDCGLAVHVPAVPNAACKGAFTHGGGWWVVGGRARCGAPGNEQRLLVLAQPRSWGAGAMFSRQLGLGHIKKQDLSRDEVMWKNTQVRTKLSFCK